MIHALIASLALMLPLGHGHHPGRVYELPGPPPLPAASPPPVIVVPVVVASPPHYAVFRVPRGFRRYRLDAVVVIPYTGVVAYPVYLVP